MEINSLKRNIVLILALLLNARSGECQDSHYWMTQVGARSTMLSGAVVGSVRDNSAIFYNPGAQAFIQNSSLAVVGDIYFYDYLVMRNGAGDSIDLYSNSLEAHPQIISGVIKNPKRPALTINYSFFNRRLTRMKSGAKNSMFYNVYENQPGDEMYNGVYDVDDRSREDWLGGGYGFRLGEHFGLGFSVFLTFMSQTNRHLLDISILDNQQDASIASLNGSSIYNVNLDYTSVGFLGKIGYAFDYESFKFGGTITLPRLPVYFVSRASFLRTSEFHVPSVSDNTFKVSYNQRRIAVFYKSPWIFDIGAAYTYSKNRFYGTLAYFSKVDKYNLLQPGAQPTSPIDSLLAPTNELYQNVNMVHKPVVNIALGYERKLADQLNLLLGFSTDFSYFERNEIDPNIDYTPIFSTWNIYHISGGVELETERINLTLGFNLGIGGNNNQLQQFNMSTPREDNFLLGETHSNVNSRYIRTSIVLGFIYYFPGAEESSN